MSISTLYGTSGDLYLQFVTDNSTAKLLTSSSSDSDATAALDTTYLDQAAAGTALATREERAAAQAQLTSVTLTRLLDITA